MKMRANIDFEESGAVHLLVRGPDAAIENGDGDFDMGPVVLELWASDDVQRALGALLVSTFDLATRSAVPAAVSFADLWGAIGAMDSVVFERGPATPPETPAETACENTPPPPPRKAARPRKK